MVVELSCRTKNLSPATLAGGAYIVQRGGVETPWPRRRVGLCVYAAIEALLCHFPGELVGQLRKRNEKHRRRPACIWVLGYDILPRRLVDQQAV